MSTVRDCEIDGHHYDLNTLGQLQCRYCGQICGESSKYVRYKPNYHGTGEIK